MKSLWNKKGFSIIEAILVSAIIPVVGLAIYSTFNSGIKIYQRINRNLALEEINLFLNDFYQDLRNTFDFNDWSFKGESERLELVSLVYDPAFKTKIPGKIIYLYQADRKRLLRQQFSYPQIYSDADEKETKILENIYNLKFHYYYLKEKDICVWQDTDLYGKMPKAVKIEFEWLDNSQQRAFVYNVFVPIAD
ncbi:MAG: type II secretion system protein GspJ [Candidatus Omnitrophica bacterium]|nr:type II secretion system protein GspJ [Candidatus Omnitrophota bacterium]